MAAPSEISVQDLNGGWTMDKTLSNDPDPVFKLQGMSWVTRTAIGMATITLHTKQYKEDDITHIDISQTLTGGVAGTSEKRTLNWSENDHTDHIFGHVMGQTRFLHGQDGAKNKPNIEIQTKVGNEEEDKLIDQFLHAEILGDGSKSDGFEASGDDDTWVQSWVRSVDNGWTAEQIWGFEQVDGKRHHTRRVVVHKDGTCLKIRLVYNFLGREE